MNPQTAISRFTAFADLEEADFAELVRIGGPTKFYNRGQTIRSEGDADHALYLLHSGWTATSIAVGDDGGQQMVKVHVPGDMLGTPSMALTRAADTLIALSRAEITVMDASAFGQIFARSPRLSALLFLISQEERIRAMDRLASLGRGGSNGRVAALMLELRSRIAQSEGKDRLSFECPLTQTHIADLVGMTNVHISRVLAWFRLQEIADWSDGMVRILDEERLMQITGLQKREVARNPAWLPGPSAGVAGTSE